MGETPRVDLSANKLCLSMERDPDYQTLCSPPPGGRKQRYCRSQIHLWCKMIFRSPFTSSQGVKSSARCRLLVGDSGAVSRSRSSTSRRACGSLAVPCLGWCQESKSRWGHVKDRVHEIFTEWADENASSDQSRIPKWKFSVDGILGVSLDESTGRNLLTP